GRGARVGPMSLVFSLKGRVALVPGASRGIGFAIAEALAQNGALVLLNGRDRASLQIKVDALAGQKLKAEVAAFDVTDASAAAKAIVAITRKHSELDIL